MNNLNTPHGHEPVHSAFTQQTEHLDARPHLQQEENDYTRMPLGSGFGEAQVDNVAYITDKNEEDIYLLMYSYEGASWVAQFYSSDLWEVHQLRLFLDRYEIDVNYPRELVGQSVTVYVDDDRPYPVTKGPEESALTAYEDNQDIDIYTRAGLQYRFGKKMLYNYLGILAVTAPVLAVSILYASTGVSVALGIVLVVLTVLLSMFGQGISRRLPKLAVHTNLSLASD